MTEIVRFLKTHQLFFEKTMGFVFIWKKFEVFFIGKGGVSNDNIS